MSVWRVAGKWTKGWRVHSELGAGKYLDAVYWIRISIVPGANDI